MTDDEEIVGTFQAKEPASPYISNRYYCPNCRKGIHNDSTSDDKCKGKECGCRCRTHYIGRDGKARPFGMEDNSFTEDQKLTDLGANPIIDELVDEWKKIHHP